jgi:glycosyltransferase involved in cell wall biosynthesis
MKYLVAQLGGRMQYGVARNLHAALMLERLVTDLCAAKGWLALLRLIPPGLRPGAVKRLVSRTPRGIPPALISHFNALGWRYSRRLAASASPGETMAAYLWAGKTFGRATVQAGFGRAGAVYVFNTAGLEILEAARAQGLKTVMEQTIAPYAIEHRLMLEEQAAFPGWEPPAAENPHRAEYIERERAEWALCDRIVCGSGFVREGVAACGGPAERCAIIPYGMNLIPRPRDARARPAGGGALRVLTVGAVGLRKGSPYVLDAARRLKGRAQFRMIGPVQALPAARRELARAVELTGSVPHADIAAHLAWADVYLLPSLCEGSALSTYEALAAGLPVVCTPNTGSVARDGVEGFIVPARDGAAIAERIERLAADPVLRDAMSQAARLRAAYVTLEAYGERLCRCLKELETPA